MAETILVSACLLGLPTRYDGTAKGDARVSDFLRREGLIPVPVCPEQLAGLPTPRPPCRFVAGDGAALLDGHGRVEDEAGNDLGPSFLRGAKATLEIARLSGCHRALLKERSPSCGRHFIHRREQIVPGQGVTCALLLHSGIAVVCEEEL